MLHAFVDESGITAHSDSASRHFVVSAVVIDGSSLETVRRSGLTQLRKELGRGPNDEIHFTNLDHSRRRQAAARVGSSRVVETVMSVVVSKGLLPEPLPNSLPHVQYLYTLKYLLQRLSWFGKRKTQQVRVICSAIGSVTDAEARKAEQGWRKESTNGDSGFNWERLESPAFSFVPKGEEPLLQLADVAASATYHAFEADEYGRTEDQYFRLLAPKLWSRSNRVLGNGLKLHPKETKTASEYEWVKEMFQTD